MSPPRLRLSLPSFLVHFFKLQHPSRSLHRQISVKEIPSPTPFVPDSKTFLSLIGRNLVQHAAKIPTWESLFSLTSVQLRKLGVEPARTRRYLLWWRDKYRRGEYGVGGDFKIVHDSVAQVRVVEVPAERSSGGPITPIFARKVVVNSEAGATVGDSQLLQTGSVRGMRILGEKTIVGPYVQPVKGTGGSVATIKVQEGMWEQKRGHKVDGGERRKVQVRRKRRLEEIRNTRK